MATTSGSGDRDRATYDDPMFVASYGRERGLQAAEEAIRDSLGPLSAIDMVDIGVGAGRTAWQFAPAVRSYLGIDFSPGMIAHCRRVLPDHRFEVGDACRLDFVADGSCDFALFSYNGIDHVALDERGRVLDEMMRILRPGGTLAFSSHNANYLPHIVERFRWRLPLTQGPRPVARALRDSLLFHWHNPTLRWRMPIARGVVNDGLHNFRSSGICYIRPDLQVAQLVEKGLQDVRCLRHDVPAFIAGTDPSVRTLPNPWIYYAGRKP
jgi:ubiquinone/menaquinone biosynthesis C-methylase UbiE